MNLLLPADPRRAQLAQLCRQGKRRLVARQYPCDWHPGTVLNRLSGEVYTESAAFEAIARALEDPGIEVTALVLRTPPGKVAYEFCIPQGKDRPPIYVKVQLGMGCVLARSFHYSDFAVKPYE